MSLMEARHQARDWAAAVVAFSAVAVGIAVFAPATIYSRVLFAWNALGAAFGPFYVLPDTEGDPLERVVPFLAALIMATAAEPRGTRESGA